MVSGSVFSETLQSITDAKLSELSSKRATFEDRHAAALQGLDKQKDPLSRVTTLAEGLKHCFDIDTKDGTLQHHDSRLTGDLNRLDRFLEQARFDPSLSDRILQEWEAMLMRHLDVQLRRYQYATLYGQLVTEWLTPSKKSTTEVDQSSGGKDMGGSFDEIPGKKRLEAREQFEKSVFEPAKVDRDAVDAYLDSLFSDDYDAATKTTTKALAALRESTTAFEARLSTPEQFTTYTVARSIRGLLKTDLFAGEKRTVLKNFQNNDIILSEIADVLNMRISALSTWSWGTGGVPVEQRRRLNGRFDIYMHEDLLQAIFLQFIGVEWSVFFKTVFRHFRRAAWKSNFRQIPRLERKRREYYLGQQETDDTVQRKRRRTYRRGYFVYHLLDNPDQEVEIKDGEEEAEIFAEEAEEAERDMSDEDAAATPAPAQIMKSMSMRAKGVGGAKRHRRIHVARLDDAESDDGSQEMYAAKKPMEKKQDLLHLLATEAAVNQRVHGSFTAFRAVFDELQNSLSHETVVAVMEFFGISKKWRGFFETYLQAPLRFLEDENGDAAPRTRKRGAPASHALSDVFSEALLFCLDTAVNKRGDGSLLYRLSDDFWFWSPDKTRANEAWNEIETFAETMSMTVSRGKSGSVSVGSAVAPDTPLPNGRIRWGMLYFDSEALRFKIDQKMVDDHVDELRKQLAAKSSIFDWIQVWNAYANVFFASNFGKAANCFGRQHVDDILATHQRIQQSLFDGKSVAQHLKSEIEQRFSIEDLSEGFLFFPVDLGGLELQSPFVAPLQIRDSVTEHPSKILDEFEANEKEEYAKLKSSFDKGQSPNTRDEVDDPHWKPDQGADEFMSFDEYVKYREEFTEADSENFLLLAYNKLLEQPRERPVQCSPRVLQSIEELSYQKHARGITAQWSIMDAYWKWVAQLYGPEMIERFGGLSVVQSGLLPIGMVGLFRDQKVHWQG